MNNYCWCGTVSGFLALGAGQWLEKMSARYSRVAPFRLTKQQAAAWAHSYDVLHRTFSEMGAPYEKLHLIFEYGLPKYPPKKNGEVSADYAIYPDAIVVSRDVVVILEFKDRDLTDPDVARKLSYSVRRYRNRIQKYHDQSWGLDKRGVLVSTLNEGIRRQTVKGITLCSADCLADELLERLGPAPKRIANIKQWRESAYSDHPAHKKALKEARVATAGKAGGNDATVG